MPIVIAEHHESDPWRPLAVWPDATYVQWGQSGLVMVDGGKSYTTAFFEAFPSDGSSGFIRGEGKDLASAEADAFTCWQREIGCAGSTGHRWTRARRTESGKPTTYTNGGCFCLGCGAFETAMVPIVEVGAWRKPLSVTEIEAIASGMCRRAPWCEDTPKDRKWRRSLALRARANGIDLPAESPRDPSKPPFEQDDYEKKCTRAVVDFYHANRDRIEASIATDGGLGAFFGEMTVRHLRSLVEAAEGT